MKAVILVLLFLGMLSLAGCGDEGCTKDTDCAEGRICGEDERCVDAADENDGPSQERRDGYASQICEEAAQQNVTTPCAEPIAAAFEQACAVLRDGCGIFSPNASCDVGGS